MTPYAALLPTFDNTFAGLKGLPRVVVDFYVAELVSQHPTAYAAFRAAGINEERAACSAGAICEEAPLASIAVDDGSSVCVARLPDGQFGLFAGCSATPNASEAEVLRDAAYLRKRLGTLWISVKRHRLCGTCGLPSAGEGEPDPQPPHLFNN